MPTNLVDSGTFTSPIVAPTDGDALNAASVVTGLQGLANRTRFLFNQAMIIGYREHMFATNAPGTVHEATSSASYVTVSTSDTISVPDAGVPCAVGDRIYVMATAAFSAVLGTDEFVYGSARLAISSSSQALTKMDGSEVSFQVQNPAAGTSVDGYTNVTMIGSHTAAYAQVYNPSLQRKKDSGTGGDLQIMQNWRWVSLVIRPRV